MKWLKHILNFLSGHKETKNYLPNNFKDRELHIKEVQKLLGVIPDGVPGAVTFGAIAQLLGCASNIFAIQRALGLPDNGNDDKRTWDKIKQICLDDKEQNSIHGISRKAYDLIIKYETGGKEYYDKYLKYPSWPGGASGVTIGIGYDLGYNTYAQFKEDWYQHFRPRQFQRLQSTLGQKGVTAKALIPAVSDIEINWQIAHIVFKNSTLPRFIELTKKAFPGSEKLDPDAFGALVSIVFNRGSKLSGKSRSEMMNIHNALKDGMNEKELYKYIADQVRSMKRIWIGKGLDGLLVRRDSEADLIENCV